MALKPKTFKFFGLTHTLLALLLGLWAAPTTLAATLQGQVVSVSDGDTLTVRDAKGRTHKVRLAGIDAPETDQAFGHAARQQLARWVLNTQVRVVHDKTDRYDRLVGTVYLQDEDINLRLVRAGLAWHNRPYWHEQPLADAVAYPWAEFKARLSATGLWQDPSPVPPWVWRHGQRGQATHNNLVQAPTL